MLEILNPVKGFGVTFATMFKKVTTEQYPEYKKPTAPRYHGRHVLNRHPDGLEKCIGCELCAWACPADAIYVEGGNNTEGARFSPGERYGAIYQINYLRCIFCGMCIEACPTRALTMTNEYELADDNRQDLIFTKEQLLAPLAPGMEMPPHPMRLGEDEQAYYVGNRPAVPRPGQAAVAAMESLKADDAAHAATAEAAAAVAAGEGEYDADITTAGTGSPGSTGSTGSTALDAADDAHEGHEGHEGHSHGPDGSHT